MTKHSPSALVVPFSDDKVRTKADDVSAEVRFRSAVGVRADAGGYERRLERHPAAAKALAKEGVDAIMVIGTSLTVIPRL